MKGAVPSPAHVSHPEPEQNEIAQGAASAQSTGAGQPQCADDNELDLADLNPQNEANHLKGAAELARKARDVINEQHNYYGQGKSPEPERKGEEARALIEFTDDLPPGRSHLPQFELDEVEDYFEGLITKRLILISCSDEDICGAAAYAVIEKLAYEDKQKRLLNLEKIGEDCAIPTIYFLKKEAKPEAPTVVLVKATGERAREFLDPLVQAAVSSIGSLEADLNNNQILMVCMVDSREIEERLKVRRGERIYDSGKELKFPHWKIPFLRPLLKHHFPGQELELEEKILRQQARGWWPEDESDLFFKIKQHIKARSLLDVIRAREDSPEIAPASTIFKGDDPLRDMVIFAATFFPNLTLQEFRRLVTLLLGEQTQIELVDTYKQNAEGITELVKTPQEKSLAQSWQSKTDRILKECQLVVAPVKGSVKVVNFDNHRSRDELRTHIEDEHPFFLETQLETIQKLGLLFDSSAQVAENVARYCALMAVVNPDSYGREWIVEVITEFEEHLDRELSAPAATEASALWVGVNAFKARVVVYHRLANLIRLMLEENQLEETVESLFKQLMMEMHYRPVLELTKRLRFTPLFDEFYWLKQLFNRGDEGARVLTSSYLYGYLKNAGTRIYQVLDALSSWLPEKKDAPLSLSGEYLLRLLTAYCAETAMTFNPKYYGSRPTQYPLLAFEEIDTAKSKLKLLLKLLFHPSINNVLLEQDEDEADNLAGTLIILWTFILLGQSVESDERQFADARNDVAPAAEADRRVPVDPVTIRDLLLEEVVAATDQTQQDAIMTHFKKVDQGLWEQIKALPYTAPQRDRLIWRRDVIGDLIEQFDNAQAQAEELRRQELNI
ncbi:MAG: hypothetical protein WCF57_08550 [Pyrinomonadaceae bacterium]